MSVILIADDQPIIREPIEMALQSAGYTTVTAANGRDALARMAEQTPDLVLLDIEMPIMDGLTALRQMRQTPALQQTKVIMLTAQADKPRIIEAAKLGVKGYLLKSSFSLSEMLVHVQRALGASASPVAAASAASSATLTAAALASENPSPVATTPPVGITSKSSTPQTTPALPHALPIAQTSVPTAQPVTQLDALRSIKPIMTKSAVADLLDKCGELKGFSPAVAEVLKLSSTDRCSVEQISKAISRDHAIALKILRLANSAVYTRGEPVDGVHKAVLRIGMGQIRQTVLNLAVMDQFRTSVIDANQFWEHAIATGMIAAEIAHARNEKEADSAFTMGLLHDVGRMAFAEQLGDAYREVVAAAKSLQLPLEQVEHRMLGATHADLMDRLFRKWRFPKEFINPIVFHHLSAGNMRDAAPQETLQIATLALADRLAHALMLGSSGNDTVYATEDLCELLRIDPAIIARIARTARDETDKVKFALLAGAPAQGNWPQMRDVHRDRLAAPLRPIYLSATPAFDACGIFCAEMTTFGEGEPPNIAIMQMRAVKERAPLADRLREIERSKNLSPLPLIVISPAGKIAPEPGICQGRRVTSIGSPFAIDRFIAATNAAIGEFVPKRVAA